MKLFLASLFLLFLSTSIFAQTEIPIGQWRMHLSYNSIHSITSSSEKIYGAAESGVVVIDPSDNSISTYTKLNGLTSNGITFIHFDHDTNKLLIAYADGNLDIIKDNEVTNFDRLKTSTLITGSKKINHISSQNGFAYLSADFGVVVFDLTKEELKETWRDIGTEGEPLRVIASTFLNDSIFLATEAGIQAGNVNQNLLSYSNWKHFALTEEIIGVATFNSEVYAAKKNDPPLRYQNGAFAPDGVITGQGQYKFITSGPDYLLIGFNNQIYRKSTTGEYTLFWTSPLMDHLQFATNVGDGKIWIGDGVSGLIEYANNEYTNYIANGPSTNSHFRLKLLNDKLYAVSGGFTLSGMPLSNTTDLNVFGNGIWSTTPAWYNDLTDIDYLTGDYYISTFSEGLAVLDAEIFNEVNSPLQRNSSPNGVFVPAVETSSDGLYVLNYRAATSLHLITPDKTWQSFALAHPYATYAIDLETDLFSNVWLVINPSQGGGLVVFDKDDNQESYLNDVVGNGALPNRRVYSVATDRDGYVWVGTGSGVAYFYDHNEDAVKPIFENRFLLKDEKITAIEVDGGNRKWIGTEKGVWLFNPTGEELVYNFTEANSPLLSNIIRDIEINPKTGEVYFATDEGIVSYRADATAGDESPQSARIFPNPVTGNFSGTVGISDLPTDAIVRITDVSGKLIWQTQANGGTATWNVRDYNGKRASTGVYVVFASSEDGRESVVGKIVVVE